MQKCVNCNKQFTSVRGLKEHTSRVHEGKKPFRCKDIYVILVRNHLPKIPSQRFQIEITHPGNREKAVPMP